MKFILLAISICLGISCIEKPTSKTDFFCSLIFTATNNSDSKYEEYFIQGNALTYTNKVPVGDSIKNHIKSVKIKDNVLNELAKKFQGLNLKEYEEMILEEDSSNKETIILLLKKNSKKHYLKMSGSKEYVRSFNQYDKLIEIESLFIKQL